MKVIRDTLSPANLALLDLMKRPVPLMKVLGVELRNQYSAHLTGLGRPYSNLVLPFLGPPESDNSSAKVGILGSGGAIYVHKLDGGVVVAKNAKNLAIPLTAKAKKWGSPSEKRGPELILTKRNDKFFLQERSYVKRVRNKWQKIKDDTLHYVLKPSVYHRPDPRAPMAEGIVGEAMNKTAEDFFAEWKKTLK